jgi:hypothetical protein
MRRQWRQHVYALLAYTAVAILFAWPLPAHMSTHLPGAVDSDTAVYVWNQWVFQHELLENRANPYRTATIFSATGGTDLAQHNYTTLANVLALPFASTFGVIAAFNLTYLMLGVLSAYAMFLLIRHLIPEATAEAWLAGLMFGWSPLMITRGMGHYSLVAALALPLFVLALLKLQAAGRRWHAVWLGVTVALAAWSDVYYPIYCVLFAALYLAGRTIEIERRPAPALDRLDRMLAGGAAALATLIVAMAWTGGWTVTLFGVFIDFRGLHTPVLLLTVVLLARVSRRYQLRLRPVDAARLRRAASFTAWAGATAAALLSPILVTLFIRMLQGDFVRPPTFWRSSPAGVDLLAFILPNPNHPLIPDAWFGWLARPYADLEHVVSLPIVALGVCLVAWLRGWRPHRLCFCVGVGFFLLSLGPFVHVASQNTYVPGPWALLRYVPVIELARTPARFAVMVFLVAAVLFADALRSLRLARPGRGAFVVSGIAALLIFELLPVPRLIAAARPPAIYARIAADPRPDVKVLELPFGISDGASSVGRFTSRTQLYQTAHHKSIIGGGLSRVSTRRVEATMKIPLLRTLIRLSEDPSAPVNTRRLGRRAEAFVRRVNLGYVVIDTRRSSPELMAFAKRALRLEYLGSDGDFELYRPGDLSRNRSSGRKRRPPDPPGASPRPKLTAPIARAIHRSSP